VSGNLEQRYRRVLRLLPGWYRHQWEEDMAAAFLDSWLTGDPDEDECVLEFCRPGWQEVASVACLAVRLHLGGVGAPRRYFAWGQAVRRAVLSVMLVHAVLGLEMLVRTAWSRRLFGLPAPPASLVAATPGGVWPTVYHVVNVAWIAVLLSLALGHYRTARVLAVLAILPGLVALLQAQLTGIMPAPFGPWAWWVLFDLVPVAAMAAFHSGAPPAARLPWLLALPAGYLLVFGPVLALEATGNSAWLPDFPGQCCLLAALACLAHVPRAWSRQAAGSGVWSLTLVPERSALGVDGGHPGEGHHVPALNHLPDKTEMLGRIVGVITGLNTDRPPGDAAACVDPFGPCHDRMLHHGIRFVHSVAHRHRPNVADHDRFSARSASRSAPPAPAAQWAAVFVVLRPGQLTAGKPCRS